MPAPGLAGIQASGRSGHFDHMNAACAASGFAGHLAAPVVT